MNVLDELGLGPLASMVQHAHVTRLAVRREPGHALAGPMFERSRPATVKTTFDALAEPAHSDRELRASLRGHVAGLLWARLRVPMDAKLDELAREEHAALASLEAPDGSAKALRAALLTAPAARLPELWLGLRSAGADERAACFDREQARREIARRLGLDTPLQAAHGLPLDTLRAAAGAVLDATDAIAHEVARPHLRETSPLAGLLIALRGDASGLPARFSARWLGDSLPELASPRLDPRAGSPLARAVFRGLEAPLLGASSFARALDLFGQAYVVATPVTALEWARRIDGAWLAPRRTGLLFASLLRTPAFLARATEASQAERHRLRRSIAVAGLFALRARAALVLAPPGSDPAELCARLYGLPLDPRLFGSLPAYDDEAEVDLLAWLGAAALETQVVDYFDEDWFRNPRAASFLALPEPATVVPTNPAASQDSAPLPEASTVAPTQPVDKLVQDARDLARRFEKELG